MEESQLAKRSQIPFPPKRWLFLFIGLVAVCSLAAAWTWWSHAPKATFNPSAIEDSAAEDPRQTFATPYRNVRPEVRYVGDETCSRCHPGHARTYRQHPMGRSLAPIHAASPVERYEEAARNPFDALGFRYRVERRGNQVFHKESLLDAQGRVVTEMEAEVHYAVGSSTHGRSYLLNRDGRLFQSPITWYPQKEIWDLSPSYAQRHHHFARPITAECLFCHSNQVLEVEQTLNHFRPPIFQGYAIGCERCHGPGELHVGRHERSEEYAGLDDTIVNPRNLTPELREAICQQCHLQGEYRVLRPGRGTFDYRPGMPLHLFLSVFVRAPNGGDTMKFVGQVEQMYASRCFRASRGDLGCISCHDPHQLPAPERRVAYYRARCLSCHEVRGCSLTPEVRRHKTQEDNCLLCHMPAGSTEVTHTAITDHRIPRQPGAAAEPAPAPRLRPGEIPLVHFHQDLVSSSDRGVNRDLAVALMDRVERYPPAVQEAVGHKVLPWLEAAPQRNRADVEAWHARAVASWILGRRTEAAATFEKVLAQTPRREATLHKAATLAMEMDRLSAARTYWERALEVNPYRYEFHYGLAALLAQTREWRQAAQACQRALQLHLANVEVRKLLIRCYLELGEKDQARAELERLLALNPPDREALRRWVQERSSSK